VCVYIYIYIIPALVFQGGPPGHVGSEEANWDPVKDSHTRIGPLALASGHGRYITVTPERALLLGEILKGKTAHSFQQNFDYDMALQSTRGGVII
jgi:hypothetical protein